ncbi:hypothetical protein NL676_037779 [Syzygium grande]|nr:hypothetical protein NL676_037779 [Syzygium grande]
MNCCFSRLRLGVPPAEIAAPPTARLGARSTNPSEEPPPSAKSPPLNHLSVSHPPPPPSLSLILSLVLSRCGARASRAAAFPPLGFSQERLFPVPLRIFSVMGL